MCVCVSLSLCVCGNKWYLYFVFYVVDCFYVDANMQHMSVRMRFVVFLISILNWKEEKEADGIFLLMKQFEGLF